MELFKDGKFWVIVSLVLFVFGIITFFILHYERDTKDYINDEIISFQDCVDAGYPVMESHPRRCMDASGRVFVEEVNDVLNGDNDFIGDQEGYYGSSTNYPCELDEDCLVSGCNSEICQGVDEETMASICLLPNQPLPSELGYFCGCFEGKCQWGK